ncbi:hypothetical protein C8Q80DRAFT_1152810, partial [Daedaleopsis nitida]
VRPRHCQLCRCAVSSTRTGATVRLGASCRPCSTVTFDAPLRPQCDQPSIACRQPPVVAATQSCHRPNVSRCCM